jgi:hypothetical protein
VEGILTPFGYSPLSSFLYALTYLPVQSSPYWLVYSCSLGRVLLFGLLWTSAYLLAEAASILASPLVMIALLFASPALVRLVAHGSHALFAAMSAFALWQLLLFYRHKSRRHLLGAAIFVALCILARSGEGIILLTVLLGVSVWLGKGSRSILASIATCLIPFGIIVGGYIFSYSLMAGRLDLGMSEYSYFTFEQGHGLAFQSQYGEKENFYVAGQMDARRLFGTPEENEYSIVTAILRNPMAYLQRVPRLVSLAPVETFRIYGAGVGLLLFLLAARGAIELVKKKHYLLL